jgi:uncharacterized Zn finger protein (UPF0148 family)
VRKKPEPKIKKVKPVSVQAHCVSCGKEFYSLTTNKNGEITCPSCDVEFRKQMKNNE